MDIHCLVINQQVFCSKYLNLSCVIEPVASTLNFIQSHGNKCYQFHEFLSEIKAAYPDLLYNTAVQSFCSGNILLQYFEQRPKTEIFLNKKPHPQPLL